ncbi:MAG: outer membrane lipoprotein carrier protein LolA [Planctomycetota bacterium]|nr:outer membrane lipoprotein carrier protein LolA [Planctomycetota bacterium]
MPKTCCLLAIALVALAIAPAFAGEPEAPAAEAPEAPTAPETIEVLDKMDAAGKDFKTVRSRFDYELNQTLYEDVTKRKGDLAYVAPNLLRFEFTDRPQETFVFDGRVLYHKKEATRQLIIWELRLPSEPPVESLELGKTPFPLPFGQKKEQVLKFFTAARDAKEEAADKDKRAVLALTPKKGAELAKDYKKVLLWVDAKAWMPTRARLFDMSDNVTTVDFRNIEINKDVDAKQFTRPSVPQDWEIVTHAKDK